VPLVMTPLRVSRIMAEGPHVAVILDVRHNNRRCGVVHHSIQMIGVAGESADEGKQGD